MYIAHELEELKRNLGKFLPPSWVLQGRHDRSDVELGKFREIDIITILIAVMVSWVSHMSKHQIVHFKYVQLLYFSYIPTKLYKFYFNCQNININAFFLSVFFLKQL